MALSRRQTQTPPASFRYVVLLFALLFCLLVSPAAYPQSTFIPAVKRVDMVHDLARSLLYITNGSDVLRYNTSTKTFLTPFRLGGGSSTLRGIDLSPDGNTLVVADGQYVFGSSCWVWIIDLPTGAVRQQVFPAAFYEAGTWAVAFGSDGACLVSSSFAGSGWVPMRRLDPQTGAVSTVATVSQDSMVSASGDGSVIGVAESNSSDGPVGRYRVSDGNWLSRSGYTDGTSWFNFEIGASRDGSQYSVPTYNGAYIYDGSLVKTGAKVGGYASAGQPIGVAYHPLEDIVYYPWAGTSQVKAFETKTLTQIGAYDVGQQLVWVGNGAFYNGRARLSRDGSLLFVTVGDPYYAGSPSLGVRMIQLSTPLTADPKSVVTNEDNAAAVTLSGSGGSGGTLSFVVTTPPSHGTLSGTAPNLVYSPDANYNGADSFAYKAVSGSTSSAPATVAITVNPVNDAPSFTAGSNVVVNEDSGPYSAPWASTVSPGPGDETSQSLTFLVSTDNTSLFTAPPTIDASGNLRFTPAPNASGLANVTVRLNDSGGIANGGSDTSAAQSFTVSVLPVNDAPIAGDNSAITKKGVSVIIAALANDSDPDGDALSIVSVTRPANGVANINPDGTVTYVPKKGFQGVDTFRYTVSDAHGGTASATVTVTVTNPKGR